MKRLGLIALLLASGSASAVNPVQGWYGGIMLGLNYTPASNFSFPTTFQPTPEQIALLQTLTLPPGLAALFPNGLTLPIPPQVNINLGYGTMGQIGGQVGYRCGKLRGEVQFAYNNSPYSTLQINRLTLLTSGTQNYNFRGATNTASLMVNGYYDFLPSDPESNFAPFAGLGIGYAYTQNNININIFNPYTQLWVNDVVNITQTTQSPAGQAMVGASYFLDDFTAFSLDARYFMTSEKSRVMKARVEVFTVNVTFNGAFNFG